MEITQLLEQRKASVEEALTIFDRLEPVSLAFMRGQWSGFEILTGHPIDGLLEPSGWYGKLFADPENVHPLLIYSLDRKSLFAINPFFIPLGINFPKTQILRYFMAILKPILKTKKSKARMRMVEYRGKLTGTMIYDGKAICDHFAKIDEDRMLGVMDLKGAAAPYFFVLEREERKWQLEL
ncbi:MAG TPA: DUF4334 domain-containing protein [Saprospiraceae bacterium]|nr:DUF4334 domain-containing protein [Saprospiraceae bacterium]